MINKDLDAKTRAVLAYILVVSGILLIAYVLYQFGNQKEVLMLIIGLISGTMIGSPIGVYFSGNIKHTETGTNVSTADTVNVNQTSNEKTV